MSGADPLVEFMSSSQQVAGLFPFCVGSSVPLVGTILGRHEDTGQVICGDPMSHFTRGLISAPSQLILGLNGRGKSSLIVRQLLGCMDQGYRFMALGDTKPDFVGLGVETGARVISVGPNQDAINPLDAGPAWRSLPRLRSLDEANGTTQALEIEAEIHSRRLSTLTALFRLSGNRKAAEIADDTLLLSHGIRQAAQKCEQMDPPRQPLLEDVKQAVADGGPVFMNALLTDTQEAYDEAVRPLLRALNIFNAEGEFGNTFCRATTTEIDVDKSVVFDISRVSKQGNKNLMAACQAVCWSYGQAVLSGAKTLHKAGLVDETHFILVLDEMWQMLRIDPLMIQWIDELTRLNRTLGIGQILCFHTPKDLIFQEEDLTNIAKGFIERSPMKFYGALAPSDMPALDQVLPLMDREKERLVSWAPDGVMDPETNIVTPPVGRGKFMMKSGVGPGKPFKVHLTDTEKRIHDTNEAWSKRMAKR